MKIKHCIYIFFILTLLTSCISNDTLKETPKYGWVNDNKFTAKVRGYPEIGISDSLKEGSALDAAFSLAKTKIEYSFLKEANKNIDKNKLEKFIDVNSKIINSEYRYGEYIELIVSIEYKNLRKILKSGNID